MWLGCPSRSSLLFRDHPWSTPGLFPYLSFPGQCKFRTGGQCTHKRKESDMADQPCAGGGGGGGGALKQIWNCFCCILAAAACLQGCKTSSWQETYVQEPASSISLSADTSQTEAQYAHYRLEQAHCHWHNSNRASYASKPELTALAADVRNHPDDIKRIAMYVTACEHSGIWDNCKWIEDIAPTKSAWNAYQLGSLISEHDPYTAIELLERSLATKLTYEDYRCAQAEWQERYAGPMKSDFSGEALKSLRVWTVSALWVAYAYSGLPYSQTEREWVRRGWFPSDGAPRLLGASGSKPNRPGSPRMVNGRIVFQMLWREFAPEFRELALAVIATQCIWLAPLLLAFRASRTKRRRNSDAVVRDII